MRVRQALDKREHMFLELANPIFVAKNKKPEQSAQLFVGRMRGMYARMERTEI